MKKKLTVNIVNKKAKTLNFVIFWLKLHEIFKKKLDFMRFDVLKCRLLCL